MSTAGSQQANDRHPHVIPLLLNWTGGAVAVELRHFAGLPVEETAGALGISAETVMRDWKYAKSWQHRELSRPRRPHGF